jgi:hypothetical protein
MRKTKMLVCSYVIISVLTATIPRFFFPMPFLPTRIPSDTGCRYNHSTPDIIQSSFSDVVFFYATKSDRRLRLSIKSLRSSGSQCRIVLFAPVNLRLSTTNADFLAHHQVDLIHHNLTNPRSKVSHMIRFEEELNWLSKHISSVSRVLHTDAFDVFFQGDPFANLFHHKLTFVVEPHCVRSCGWNLAWIRKCYGDSGMYDMGHKFIVCSGSIGGSATQYLVFLRLLTRQPEWKTCWGSSLDQPIVNHMMWNGDIARAGIKYELTGCDGGFFTMQWCVSEGNVLRNERGQVVSAEGVVPSYLHQYNRNPKFAAKLFRACGL